MFDMRKAKYILKNNEIQLVCDSQEAQACCELIRMRDSKGSIHSDFWGHPTFNVRLSDGCTLVSLPVNVQNISVVHDCGVFPDRSDKETMQRLSFFVPSKKEFSTNFPLMPFQIDGGRWLVQGDLRRILAYPMGLGKTITAMAAIMAEPEKYLPAIIIAPAHVKLNWASEWEKWGGNADEVAVLFGRTPNPSLLLNKKLIVLNHHILSAWNETLISMKPKTLIIDEAHSFVNSNTKTYPVALRLAKACSRRVLLLTATPLVNDLNDLWGLCNLINPDILGTKGVFEKTFMPEESAKKRMFASRWSGGFQKTGWQAVARARLPKDVMDKRIEELGSILRRLVILRVEKGDVYDQLPNITETKLRIDVPRTTQEGKAFWLVEETCQMQIAEAKEDVLASDQMLPAFNKARQNAASVKVKEAIEWIQNFLDESSPEEKLVVVGWSVKPLEELHAHFRKHSLLINGNIDARKKKERGDTFKSDPQKRILFGNVKSIGTGIDQLAVASTMFFLELPLTAVDFEQAKGRIDRLSQKSKALSYYYMTVKDSIEEKMIWKIITKKQKMTKQLGL